MLEKILERINEKGWNLYEIVGGEDPLDVIPRGPAESLEIGMVYCVFPITENPRDASEVLMYTRHLAEANGSPTISYSKGRIPLMAFEVLDDNIYLVCGGIGIPYEDFYKALESLTFVKKTL